MKSKLRHDIFRILAILYHCIMKKLFTLLLFISLTQLLWQNVWAQQSNIVDFDVKENLSQNGKLAIIAVDSLDKTNNNIQGNYKFTINGFQQDLQFNDGVAVTANPIESSTFVFFKHNSPAKEIGKLYFLRVTEKGISPFKISGFLLIALPLLVLFIAYKFKRFLVTLLILAAIYLYLNYSKGLDVKQLIESSIVGLKDLI